MALYRVTTRQVVAVTYEVEAESEDDAKRLAEEDLEEDDERETARELEDFEVTSTTLVDAE